MEQEVKQVATPTEELEKTREDFYKVSLSLFEAAKILRSYDVLFTDVLLGQAQYFLNLADDYDILNTVVGLNKTMPFKNIGDSVSEEVKAKIDEYAQKIRQRLDGDKDASV